MDKDLAPRHPIRVAAQRTGLTPATLRSQARRVERLTRLRLLTEAGRAISQVAELTDKEAKALLAEDREAAAPDARTHSHAVSPDRLVDTAFHFVQTMNDGELEYTLRRSAVTLGAAAFLDQVVGPLLHRIGQAWADDELHPGQEHVATVVVERVLGWVTEPISAQARGPRLLVATLPEERHGLGAKLAGATAALEGWQVCDMGTDLPTQSVLSGARTLDAKAVALSLVNREHNGRALASLRELREGLPETTRLLVGGGAAEELGKDQVPAGVEILASLGDLRKALGKSG